MDFLDRQDELRRLRALARLAEGSLAVVYGRRRIGKTRLLVEWARESGGVYTVADLSAPEVQRAWFASAVSQRLPGLADATWPDWAALLRAVARSARQEGWRGPLILDELPYLVEASPELPSVLQRWIDHDAREAGLVVVLAGSSQRMMQGLVLDAAEPLHGRASAVLRLGPLPAWCAPAAFGFTDPADVAELVGVWGGVPRYWELAAAATGTLAERVDEVVLDPLGPLHDEPDRLLLEETPPATALRPILDAIGMGAHRLSEIGGRIGRSATSLARPIGRLVEMGLVRRDVPFDEAEASSKRSLYRIDDPFLRLWFRVVAPHRARLAVADREDRLRLLADHLPFLLADSWEEACRAAVPRLPASSSLGALGPWGPAGRWWRGNAPEWDVVARSIDGQRLLLGEAKADRKTSVRAQVRAVAARPAPPLAGAEVVRALFVPEPGGHAVVEGVHVVGAADVLGFDAGGR